MNNLIKLFTLLFLLPITSFGIDLQTAISTNKVKATFMGNGGHRGECIKLVLKNTSSKNLKIEIQPGTYLTNNDSTEQDLIIVDDAMIVLGNKEQKETILNGLCCKKRRRCPSKGGLLTLKPSINPIISGLAKLLINTKEVQYAGQTAMWTLVDNENPNYITGADSTKTMQLRAYVGKALNKVVKPFIWTDYNRTAVIVSNQLSIKSSGNHYVRNVKANDLVQYAIYNEADSAISDIRSAKVIANRYNKHNVKWNIELEELDPTKKYYLKIKVNGVIYKEWMYYFWS